MRGAGFVNPLFYRKAVLTFSGIEKLRASIGCAGALRLL